MYYVYLLINKEGDKHYLGYTSDLRRRIKEHLQNKPYWSKRLDNKKLLYYEAYESKEKAFERERKLKQYGSAYKGLLKRLGLK